MVSLIMVCLQSTPNDCSLSLNQDTNNQILKILVFSYNNNNKIEFVNLDVKDIKLIQNVNPICNLIERLSKYQLNLYNYHKSRVTST